MELEEDSHPSSLTLYKPLTSMNLLDQFDAIILHSKQTENAH